MAIDPAIANPAPMKLDDPLERYGNFLRSSYLQGEIAKAQNAANSLATQRAAYNQPGAVDLKTGRPDAGIISNFMAKNNAGDAILPFMNDTMAWKQKQADADMNVQKAGDQ